MHTHPLQPPAPSPAQRVGLTLVAVDSAAVLALAGDDPLSVASLRRVFDAHKSTEPHLRGLMSGDLAWALLRPLAAATNASLTPEAFVAAWGAGVVLHQWSGFAKFRRVAAELLGPPLPSNPSPATSPRRSPRDNSPVRAPSSPPLAPPPAPAAVALLTPRGPVTLDAGSAVRAGPVLVDKVSVWLVFRFLAPLDLVRASQVCRLFAVVGRDDALWAQWSGESRVLQSARSLRHLNASWTLCATGNERRRYLRGMRSFLESVRPPNHGSCDHCTVELAFSADVLREHRFLFAPVTTHYIGRSYLYFCPACACAAPTKCQHPECATLLCADRATLAARADNRMRSWPVYCEEHSVLGLHCTRMFKQQSLATIIM